MRTGTSAQYGDAIAPVIFTATASGEGVLWAVAMVSVEGGADTIGITLRHADGGLYYSSLWDGSTTDEDEPDAGDLVVR